VHLNDSRDARDIENNHELIHANKLSSKINLGTPFSPSSIHRNFPLFGKNGFAYSDFACLKTKNYNFCIDKVI